ncbi:hypothetical protein ACFCYF_38765 [Streptomyces chartreusis]|uniref:hypothetical protein n=1 Tax=Streptomyces chartreusis TaxID=1969 RepID=UPI0035D67177
MADGSAVIHGARPWQGSYGQSNIGDALVDIEPTGPFARADLLVLRVEDPQYEGELDPARDQIGYFHVVRDVDAETTTVPEDMSAIPLARIALPRDTGTVTADMITDLRQLANPRHRHDVHTAHPTTTQQLPGERGTWQTWPAEAAWDVAIPAWATQATVTVTLSGLRIEGGNVWAELRPVLGGTTGRTTVIDDNQTGIHRVPATLAHTYPLPSSLRGTVQRLTVQTNESAKYGKGDLYVAAGTAIVATVDFTENPE